MLPIGSQPYAPRENLMHTTIRLHLPGTVQYQAR